MLLPEVFSDPPNTEVSRYPIQMSTCTGHTACFQSGGSPDPLPTVIQLAATRKAEEIRELVAKSFPGGSVGKESACNVGDLGSIPGLGWSPRVGNGNPLQYSCLATMGSQRVGYDLAQHNRGPHGGRENSQKASRLGTSQGAQSIILLLREIIRDYVVNIMLIYFFKTLWSKNNTVETITKLLPTSNKRIH